MKRYGAVEVSHLIVLNDFVVAQEIKQRGIDIVPVDSVSLNYKPNVQIWMFEVEVPQMTWDLDGETI